MVFGFGKKDKKKDGIAGAGQAAGKGEVLLRDPSLPAEIATSDAAKWKKLLEYIDTHPLFKLLSFDGLCWVDPFKGELVSAPFDLEATVRKYLAKHQHWKTDKLKSPLQLRHLIWAQYLQDNLDTDKRFVLFQSDGLWYNPWSKTRSPKVTLAMFSNRKQFIKAAAQELAQFEDANPRTMLKLDRLERVMRGELDATVAVEDDPSAKNKDATLKSGIHRMGDVNALPEAEHHGPVIAAETARHSATKSISAPTPEAGEPVIEADGSFGSGLGASPHDFKVDVSGKRDPTLGGRPPPSNEEIYRSLQQINERLAAQGQTPVPMPAGVMPAGVMPAGMMPAGMMPAGAMPAGAMPAGAMPVGAMPAGAMPAGTMPAGMMPAGAVPFTGPVIIPTSPVVFPVAQQLINGLISLRGAVGPRDAEEVPVGDATGAAPATHSPIPTNVPMVQSSDLSPELIKQLIESLHQVSLVARHVSSYSPGTRAAGSSRALTRKQSEADRSAEGGGELSPFEEADREADEEGFVPEPQVRTDHFVDPDSNLDIDKAFARLQARQARGEKVDEAADGETPAADAGAHFELDIAGEDDSDPAGQLLDIEGGGEAEAEDEAERIAADEDHAQDMRKAANIQNHLLGGIPALNDVAIALHYEPFAEIGGDFYNVIKLNEDRFFFIIGDVAGHGVQAALIVSSIVNTLRIIFRERQTFELVDIMCEMNDYMRECLMTGQFFTAYAGILTTGKQPILECACCGHHPAICLNREHEVPIRELGRLSMGIGLVRTQTFRQNLKVDTCQLNPGDTICIYTDGIVEVMDENGEELGDAFARSSLFSHMDDPIENLIDAVLADIHSEMVGQITDDQTVMVIKVLDLKVEAEVPPDDQADTGDSGAFNLSAKSPVDGAPDPIGTGDPPPVPIGPEMDEAGSGDETPDAVIAPGPADPDTDIVFNIGGLGDAGLGDESKSIERPS
jgi:serine phosphatase RsbU (regulator of sigma subunit)